MTAKHEASRRDFLTGRAALEAIRGLADHAESPPPKSPLELDREANTPSFLVEISRPAMAVEFQIFLNAGQPPSGPEVALQALDLVDALEDQLSVYREHSEVSQINRRASLEPVAVEPRLFGLLQQSLAIYAATTGAFDITSGPLSKVWGFFRRQGRFPQEADIREALERVGSQWLTLDRERTTVQFLKLGIEINFHAIGKGYSLDRAAELLRQAGIEDYLIHGGQSSILASGSRAGASEERRGWWVALRHPLRAEQQLGEIRLQDRALGTSGSGVQFFYHQGRRFGHILDPRTGWPSEGVLSATVLAPTAAEADALATAFTIWEPEQTAEFCRQREDVAAILVCPGERAGSLSLHTLGMSDTDWRVRL
ncbi:MAG: FAD:protein FMN transferase [Planctomycetota bacterium]|nr:FAD:protein FMN transferase [Planctomycetota bacterium]